MGSGPAVLGHFNELLSLNVDAKLADVINVTNLRKIANKILYNHATNAFASRKFAISRPVRQALLRLVQQALLRQVT